MKGKFRIHPGGASYNGKHARAGIPTDTALLRYTPPAFAPLTYG